MSSILTSSSEKSNVVELNIENKVRGVRIIAGDEAKERRQLLNSLIKLGRSMIAVRTEAVEVAENVKRGLSYYVADGFEIAAPELGAQKQVLGGGSYKEGIGFAIGFDRLMLCNKE